MVGAPSAPGGLLFGEQDGAFGRAGCGRFHRRSVRGIDLVVVQDRAPENCPVEKRGDDVGKQQVRNCAQLVSGGRMARDVNTQAAKLLDQTPDFGTSGADFVGDFRAADDDRSVVGQQANNAPETRVGFLGRGRNLAAGFGEALDAGIMREQRGKW